MSPDWYRKERRLVAVILKEKKIIKALCRVCRRAVVNNKCTSADFARLTLDRRVSETQTVPERPIFNDPYTFCTIGKSIFS